MTTVKERTDEGSAWLVLFDFDGVVVNTESQYSRFWHRVGTDYLGMDDLEFRVKGQTLVYIYDTFFRGRLADQQAITAALDRFELTMDYEYVPGVLAFIEELKRHGVKIAVVTSSNARKMEAVYKAKPALKDLFDKVLTAEMFGRSKPHPDCFLKGMETFGVPACRTYVFEDSFNGLRAARDSEATVIGLATTNSPESIAPLCDAVIADFRGFTFGRMLETRRLRP